MHPFFSYPISQIRSVCIISYPFHMKWSPAVANIGCTIVVLYDFFQTHSPFPSLPRSLFLIQTQFAFSHKDVLAKYISKIAFSSASVNFLCVLCASFFHSFLPKSFSHGDGWIYNCPTVCLSGLTPRGKLNLLKCFSLKRRLGTDKNVAWESQALNSANGNNFSRHPFSTSPTRILSVL